MTHTEFLSSILRCVRTAGAASALTALRADRPAFHDDGARGAAYHDTLAVFYVWSVDRLVAGGLSNFGVLCHPLLDSRSPLVWWSPAVLADAAAEHFVASDLARTGEPQPTEPLVLLAA